MDQLLTTKLNIPQLNINLVTRPRLYKRLDEGVRCKLTLISAPTGFGKSTLVTGWLSERDQHIAWLSLDSGDNDPVRFWSYLIAAIQTIQQEVGVEAFQIVSALQMRNTVPVAISLINDISQISHDLILILDDYHLIETEQIHVGFSYLLDHQPPNFHIILITRLDPSISLARLRVHGQLIEIRAEDLQFSIEEATTLLNGKMGLNLKPEHIEALNTRTESWVVGLQLAALSLKGQSSYDAFIEKFTGEQRFILDYLVEEVLGRLPDAQRGFMLRTSILERFCSKLCQAIMCDTTSGQILDKIWRRNLFLIPLDTEGRWFRYQHLFGEVLYVLLERDHPDEISALHLRASAWFEREGYYSEAVDHALLSGNMVVAREQVLKHWLLALHRGEIATVLRWLDALPESKGRADPYVPLARCWALFLSWQYSAIGIHLELANKAFEQLLDEGTLSEVEQNQIAAQLAMMRSVLARNQGEHAKSVAYAEEAAHLIPQESLEGIGTAWNILAAARAGAGNFDGAIEAYEHGIALSLAAGNLVGAYGCIYGQSMYKLAQGRLNEAEKLCGSAIERSESEGHGEFPAAGSLYITMARLNLERYHLDEAEAYLNTGLRIARPGGFGEAVRTGRYLRAHLAAAHGNLDAAVVIFQDTARIVNATEDPYLIGELSWEWARLYINAGDQYAAREKLHILEEKIATTQHANLLLWWRWLFPRLLCEEGRYDEALSALNEFIHRARTVNNNGELIRLLTLQALTLVALKDRILARDVLREALSLGAPEGYIWLWLSAGPGIVPLLRDMRNDSDTPPIFYPYLNSLLEACQTAFSESSTPQFRDPLDTLTPRELEIIRLICQGYSNPEIASELVVTLNTIKKHTSNIYSKLGICSRTQAIARARDLGLV